MKNARELMLGYIEGTAEQSASLFAEAGTLELPYLASIGYPSVLKGPEEIGKFLAFLHDTLYPGFAFEGVKIDIDTPSQVFAEYQINHRSGISGKDVRQQFFGHLGLTTVRSSSCAKPSTSSWSPRRSFRTALRTSSLSERNRARPKAFWSLPSFLKRGYAAPRRHIRRAERIMQLTSEQADKLIGAARTKAKAIGIAVSVAILDSAGHMKAFSRMDGAWLGSSDVALRKARTSVLFEAETHSIWDICKPDAQAHGLEHTNGGLVTFAGGIPLRAVNGDLLGAIGVSGARSNKTSRLRAPA